MCLVAAGEDGLLLAYSAAVEQVLPQTPLPPAIPACQGCTPHVELQTVNYSGERHAKADDVTSLFSLHFDGVCAIKEKSAAGKLKMGNDRHSEL